MSRLIYDKAIAQKVLALVDAEAFDGLTIAELREKFPAHHHGTLSGVLSILHRDNALARLSDKRGGCKVYVHPDYLDGRSAEAQGRGGPAKEEVEHALSVVGLLEYWLQVDTAGARFTTDKTKAERNPRLFFKELKQIAGVTE